MEGSELAFKTCKWISENREAFDALMFLVREEKRRGNPSVQRGDVWNLAREKGLDVSDIPGLKRDNNLWAGITRYMVMIDPSLCSCLSFRPSKLDVVDLRAMWHDHVDESTVFQANGRAAASALWCAK